MVPLKLSKSEELKARGQALLPALSQTFSKSPSSFVEGIYPIYAMKAEGCYLFDVDGNKYIDYLMGLGPVVLGYNYSKINEAILSQLKKGIIFSLPHESELTAAEAIKNIIPCAEMTRFTKTGSDAVTGALRAARAITKRNIVLYCGSGGVWDDWYSVATNRNQGIPPFNLNLIKIFDYNNLPQLEELFSNYKNQIAAVVFEPCVFDSPRDNFLENVKKITHENESLLIYDEILTGFRMSNGGGQEFFRVTPDIATFAKGIANGMPLGAIVGKTEYMKAFNEVFVSTTFGGEALSLAACISTIDEFIHYRVCEHMWNIGTMIKDGFNKLASETGVTAKCIGYPPRLKLLFLDQKGNDSLLYKSLFLQELVEAGVFVHPNALFVSYSHTKDNAEFTLNAVENALNTLERAIDGNVVNKMLRGNIVKEVIKRIV